MPTASNSDGAVLRSALSAITRRMRRDDEPGPIGPAAFGLLALLRHHGPMSASELAECARVEPQSISRPLATLEEHDLIGRRVDEGDRRRAVLSASPLGDDLVVRTIRKRNRRLDAALAEHCSAAERATLREAATLLERLAEASREAGAAREPQGDAEILNIVPFTEVADVARSIAFYEPLGFVVDGRHELEGRLIYASLRGRKVRAARIAFARSCGAVVPEAQRVSFYCWTDDVAGLRARLSAAGYAPSELAVFDDKSAGEFALTDPDGYTIKIGQVRHAAS